MNSTLRYVGPSNKIDSNEQIVPSKRRIHRQHTDPTTIGQLTDKVNGSTLLESQHSINSSLITNNNHKYLSKNFETIFQKLSQLQDTLQTMKNDQKDLKIEFNNLRLSVGVANQLMSRSLGGESIIKTPSSSTFAITKMQIGILLDSIPVEIRLVFIVLMTNFIINYIFQIYNREY